MNGVNDSIIYNNRGSSARIHPITKLELNELGLDESVYTYRVVDNLKELESFVPHMIIAECVSGTKFVQNRYKEQEIIKKNKYVMALGIYQQLCKDPSGKIKILKPTRPIFKNVYKRYIGQDLTGKTLLVWRTGGIGDLLFIKPNLDYLKEKYEDCKIIFACGPQYQPMVNNWECIDKVVDLPFSMKYLVTSDYHLLFEGVIERCNQAHTENSYRLFTRWCGLNLPDNELIPKQNPEENALDMCYNYLMENNIIDKDFILLQMRASSPIRTPSPEFWIKVINELTDRGHNILLTDAVHKAHEISSFIKKLKNQDKVFNFSEKSRSVDLTIAMASLAKLCLSTDTALTHIAESVNVKSFGIYGPFPGSIRLETYRKSKWVDAKADCSPCFLHGHKPCPNSTGGYSNCYNNIDIVEMINNIERFMNDQDIPNSQESTSNN